MLLIYSREDKLIKSIFRNNAGDVVFPVGLQAHNSSTGSKLLSTAIEAVKKVNGNCIEAPVYWYLLEPEKDSYDVSHVKTLINEARKENLYLIILWFGTSKNGHPNYVPEYIKSSPDVYLMARGRDGAEVEALSVHCVDTMERDKRAFCRLMEFIRDYDAAEHTVLAVQVENEMGYGGTDRDYSYSGEMAYKEELPDELRDIDIAICGPHDADRSLSPWKQKFGRYAQEAFSAWYTAKYVNTIAAAGKQIYDLPMLVNVMLGENGFREPGICYNSGAPVSRMIDVWKIAAPSIDLICPDIYPENRDTYNEVCHNYKRDDNPLFVPESPIGGEANAMNMINAVAGYGAIGMFCFGAESMFDKNEEIIPESQDVALSLRIISSMSELLMKYGSDKAGVYAITENEFETEHYFRVSGYHVIARFIRHNRTCSMGFSPAMTELDSESYNIRGRAIMIQTENNEFYLCGAGVALDFIRIPDEMDEDSCSHMKSRAYSQLNFLSVEEGHTNDGKWVCDFRRNGDETNFSQYVLNGETIRIRLNPSLT